MDVVLVHGRRPLADPEFGGQPACRQIQGQPGTVSDAARRRCRIGPALRIGKEPASLGSQSFR